MTEQKSENYWKGQIDLKLDTIYMKVDRVESDVKDLREMLVDGGDNPGLIAKVRENTEWRNKLEKAIYVVGIAIILDIVVRVLNSQALADLFHHVP